MASLPSPVSVPLTERIASAVFHGLTATPKTLPPWLFYDDAGSDLFDQITRLPEYYLTRTEHSILLNTSDQIIDAAAQGHPLHITELGAGSSEKTSLLLAAALRRQPTLVYEPVDVSAAALDLARLRLESELPGLQVLPRVADYTLGLRLAPLPPGHRRLVLYIGSSIGNFEPCASLALLRTIRYALLPGDAFLLGVDLVKPLPLLLAAYNDATGVTAAFNRNLLARINRELDADFDPLAFAHRAIWNSTASRIEMHLESLAPQTVHIPALPLSVSFAAGERIHTENSYKYRPGQAEALLTSAALHPAHTFTDDNHWFAVTLAHAR